MERTNDGERTHSTEDQLVNYMPAMPTQSAEPGRAERFVGRLLRRRGALRPVTRDGN